MILNEYLYLIQENNPNIIDKIGFDFDWDNKKVWKLDIPEIEIPISKLTWHFHIPFWIFKKDYDLKPIDVINNPEKYKTEYQRIMKSDVNFPIDVMKNKGKLLILDGLHRLAKLYILNKKMINVRIIPRNKIPEIKI